MRQLRSWKRSLSSETRELDAFRELVEVEDRLERYPNAVPSLETALKLYTITGREKKIKEFQMRLSRTENLF